MSIGEDRVRTKFNPSANTIVDQIKQKSAELINMCADMPKPEDEKKARRVFSFDCACNDALRRRGYVGGKGRDYACMIPFHALKATSRVLVCSRHRATMVRKWWPWSGRLGCYDVKICPVCVHLDKIKIRLSGDTHDGRRDGSD